MAYKFQLGTFQSPGDIKLVGGADLSGSALGEFAGNIVPGRNSDILPAQDGVSSLGSLTKSIKQAFVSGSNSGEGKDLLISDNFGLGHLKVDDGEGGFDEYYGMFNHQAGSSARKLVISASSGIEIMSHDVTGDYEGLSVWGTDALFYETVDSSEPSASITREGVISGSSATLAGNLVSKHGALKASQLSGSEAVYLGGTGELRVGSSARLNVSGNVFLPDNSITNDNLAGSIANSKLANSSITLSAGAGMAAMGEVSLGESVTVAVDGNLADIDSLAVTDGGFIVGNGSNYVLETGNTARASLGLGTSDSPTFAGVTINGNMSASGDLYVAGTLTSVNTDELVIKDKHVIIGSGSASKSDAAGSAVQFSYAADLSDYFEWVYLQNGTGDAAASGDIFVARNESGDLIDIQAANIYGTVTGDIVSNVQGIGNADGTLQVGFNHGTVTFTDNRTWTLPASPTIGQVVHVKAPESLGGYKLIISKAGSQTIDGDTTIDLVSDFGAVNLMYIDSDKWSIY